MTHTMLLLYLIGQADNIIVLFGFSSVFLGIAAAVLLLVSYINDMETKKPAWILLSIFFPCVFIAAAFPSTKTLELMVAGDVVVQAAQNEQVQSIAGSSVKILDHYLKDVLKKQESENNK